MPKKAGEKMAKSNYIVRGGGDFSGLYKEFNKAQKEMNNFQSSINKTMSGIGKAFKIGLGYISARAIAGFVKTTTGLASDMTEVQNVVDVTFGSMAKDINEFSKTSIEQFGLSELAAKKYSSTMGAMLKSSGIKGTAVKDMSLDLTKLSADMASFYNLDNDVAFQKIMSGMSGMSMPLKELGINMNVANLEAFAMSQGIKKSWQEMSQAEQTMLRYKYLLSVTGDAQGDFSRNQYTWANQTKILSQQFEILKGTIGQGFINMLMPVVKGLNILIKKIQVAAEYFKAFTGLIFGNAEAGSQGGKAVEVMTNNLGGVEDNLGGIGKAGEKAGKGLKKAGKEAKGALAGFDELNTLAKNATSGTDGGAGGLVDDLGGVGPVDLGAATNGELDIDTSTVEGKFKRLTDTISDFYNNWGMKDIFDGIKAGAELVNFDNIRENFRIAFEGLGEIARTAFEGLQPIFQSAGEMLGTIFKYGIATIGNIFEPISLGFANFVTNMKGPIQSWIAETSQTITNGFNNLTGIFEMLGQSWLNSINKYKPTIAQSVEDTFTNISETVMLVVTVVADTFEIITGKIKEFVENNQADIQDFMDSILGIFTDVWGLINDVWSDTLNLLKDFWDNWGLDIVSGVMDVVTQIGEWFLYLWNDLVKPVWDKMLEWMKKIWNESLKGIVEELLGFVGRVGELIKVLWEKIIQPLLDWLIKHVVPHVKNVLMLILDLAGSFLNGIGEVIKGLLKALNGILDFLIGAFTGDWKRAWEGVRNIFKGIVDSLVGIFKIPLNWIISGINTFIRGLNNIKIPDWVPGVGGKGFHIAEIPKLAKGGITNGPTIAMIGDNPGGKEVVSPLDDLTDIIASAVGTAVVNAMQFNSSGSNDDTELTIELDGTKLGRVILPKLNQEADRLGYKPILQVD